MNSEERIEAIWCTDAETGQRLLVDLHTNEILARQNEKGEIIDANQGY